MRDLEEVGVMEDLEEAIYVGRETIEVMPQDHPNRAGFLSSVGILL
jgi:hypothetical protein